MTEFAERDIVQDIYNNIQAVERSNMDTRTTPDRGECTYFAPGTVFEGTLHSDRDVEIAGEFRGEIVSDGKVTLHADSASSVSAKSLALLGSTLTGDSVIAGDVQIDGASRVKGNIRAADVDCAGTIDGNINAGNRVSLQHTAAVKGDIKAATMEVEYGAQIRGQIDMS